MFEPNPFYNNYHYILQTPEYVVIVMEEESDAGIYESDCHEHNRGLANILSAARAEEKKK